MTTHSLSKILAVAAVAGATTFAAPASAHINMVGELIGRNANQKAKPCEGGTRGDGPIYTFEPGATIELGVMETIPHPGYFRISFDDDGEDFMDPQSIDPIDPNRYGTGKECEGTAADHCGESDFCNSPTVLWDNLDPHMPASFLDTKAWKWTVTLPNVECDNCTIQVMQVMEDPAGGAHGPFDGEADLYYRCIDVELKKGAGKTPGTVTGAVGNKGMQCSKGATPGGEPKPDAGASSGGKDAGVDEVDEPAIDDPKPSNPTGSTTKDAGTKKDAGTAKDAGHAHDEGEDDDGDAPAAKADEGGCAISQTPRSVAGPLWLLLGLGALLARRGRVQRLAHRRS